MDPLLTLLLADATPPSPDRESAVQLIVRVLPALFRAVLASLTVDEELSTVHLAQLAALRRLSGRSYQVMELARELGVRQSTLTATVDSLVRRGWVERARDHGGDRRVVLLTITPAGRQVCAHLIECAHGRMAELLRDATPEEIAALGVGLAAVDRALGDYACPLLSTNQAEEPPDAP